MQGERIFNYVIEDQLGAGGFGEVWSARHTLTGDRVAVKILYQTAMYDLVEALRKEALILHALSTQWRDAHPGVVPPFVQFIDVGEVKDHPAIIMEMLHGRELRDELVEDPRRRSPEETLAIVRPLLQALAFAHAQGIVHRDVKPENVFLCSDGTLKLMDLGIAKVQQAATAKSTKIMGSLQYMAPERFEAVTSPGVDVYAAGLIAWELLAGRPACEHETPTGAMKWHVMKGAPPIEAVAPGVPAWLAAAITRMVDIDPDKRVASAEAAVALLDQGAVPPQEETRWVREARGAAPAPAATPAGAATPAPVTTAVAAAPAAESASAPGGSPPREAPPPPTAPEPPRRRRPVGAIVGAAVAVVALVGLLVVVGVAAAGAGAWIWLQPVDDGATEGGSADIVDAGAPPATVDEPVDSDAVVDVEEPPPAAPPAPPAQPPTDTSQSAEERQRELARRQKQAEVLIARGWDAVESHSLDEARALFDEAVRLDPTNPAGLLGLGAAVGEGGDFEGGHELMCKAMRLDSDRLRALTGMAREGYDELRRRPLWCSSETPGTRSAPGSTTGPELVALGWQKYRSVEMESAGEIFGRAIEVDPDNPDTLYGAGRFALESGEPEAAREVFCHALLIRSIDPGVARQIDRLLATHQMSCPAAGTAEDARDRELLAKVEEKAAHVEARAQGCGDGEIRDTVSLTVMEVRARIEAGNASEAREMAAFLDELLGQVDACVTETERRLREDARERPPASPY